MHENNVRTGMYFDKGDTVEMTLNWSTLMLRFECKGRVAELAVNPPKSDEHYRVMVYLWNTDDAVELLK